MRMLLRSAVFTLLLLYASAQHPSLRTFYRQTYYRLVAMRFGLSLERDVMITMRDGTHLATDVYLPPHRESRLPTIFIMLPYDKKTYGGGLQWVWRFGRLGYAIVIQDMRGRFGSEGIFAPYDHVIEDGVTTLDWITAQGWSNGRIATVGCSALGESQVILAKARHPNHTTMIAEGAGGAIGRGGASRGYFGIYIGGIPHLATGFGWFASNGGKTSDAMGGAKVDLTRVLAEFPSGTLVSRFRKTPTDYEDFLSRFEDDAFWERLGYLTENNEFASPALHVNTWQDVGVRGTFEIAALMRANGQNEKTRQHQHVVIGPGDHCVFSGTFATGRVGDLDVNADAALGYEKIYEAWLDHWLRDKPLPQLAAFTFYVLSADRWQTSQEWPPVGSQPRRLFLGGDKTLSSALPAPGEAVYRYDPNKPTPSLGGAICCTGQPNLRTGPIDQRPNEKREDVLSFRSARLDAPLALIGDISAELAFSTDAPDTDIIVKVLDERPDGSLIPIQEGALRLRYRDGFERPSLIEPGSRFTARIEFPPIAYEVAIGHRLGLHISSSAFPRLERNLNTGRANYLETEPRVAVNTLHFGGVAPSVLILPVWHPQTAQRLPKCPQELKEFCS